MSVIISILVFLLSLSVVIILHELGHFVMARRAGILCHEFSLGMGPVLYSKKKGETTYSIRAIPIGGYVMMAGEEIEDDLVTVGKTVRLRFDADENVSKIILDTENPDYENDLKVTIDKVDLKGKNDTNLYINDYTVNRDAFYVMKKREMQIAPYDRGFNGKNVWQRFGTIFGGPFMNFLLAFLVFIVVNLMVGFPDFSTATLGSVGETYDSSNYLEPGDQITRINDTPISDWEDISSVLNESIQTTPLTIEYIHDNSVRKTADIIPVIYFYNLGFHSDETTINDVILGDVTTDSKAYKAGFETGDHIVSVNGTDVASWDALIDIVKQNTDAQPMTFVVERAGNNYPIEITPYKNTFLETQDIESIDSLIGIGPEMNFSFIKSIRGGAVSVKSSATMIFTTIGLLFDSEDAGEGIGVDDLAGPVGIYEITSRALSAGLVSLLGWIGLLSVNLGVINLLPIPALDGGRLVFLGYEAITSKKPNKRIENTLHYVMYLALMGLFVFITFNDILRLFNIK
ncbi:MAG: RIP metalloprotease RseP [Candidatus Izimaplasma sp.]|nr:RIP metalloprotease RseP [Candidatus Izimaplasma bacterium]